MRERERTLTRFLRERPDLGRIGLHVEIAGVVWTDRVLGRIK
jgi:hypothetical protein